MKAWKVLAVVLTSLLLAGCVSKEKAMEPAGAAAPRPVQGDAASEQLATVAHMRPQHRVDCN
jgi:outer membrane murein-binding lipoprotein Lpp